ncbi:2,3-dihydro-2,3-dihydroxybenzoate dehydrogenase [Vibrio mangrovi]|uniref:2,3-dihydro-2,3-dihydroxybenzoate dehydrogenase n=1 Tax=Vibrio mangrovi TaxID=474394 RepID=A0A1Y6IUD1_9VIBR|nr:2,3-dihydro-2,3-dihydroxybenzoate dehydrogenase [Vibrio mangrovi]MDW6003037.1 2,3-dihydro-2,3-dihydroxybenzoate dehydrogenase [Vibrio mangrovi]SMS01279.1 2,3-dihydro-2,3-dihydroxybenzoate dehydrogenase [Vibrio mangrovi]
MSQEQEFTGQNVWVTGAGQGIGAAVAKAFSCAGATVFGLDKTFAADDYPYRCITVDLAQSHEVTDCCHTLLENCSGLDVLVNCAGILRMGATDELSHKDWQDTFAVNVGAAFHLFQQAIPVFKQQHSGAIVTIASNAAQTPRIGMSAYGASKAALRSLTMTVGLELAEYGVRANLVSPGSTDTQMQRSLWNTADAEQQTIQGFPQQYKLGIPLRKIATPAEIAQSVLFLASKRASHITMQDLVIDGGATLGR